MAKGNRRDVTTALMCLLAYRSESNAQDQNLDTAISILVDIDARTGRRDPSKRPRKTGKRRGRPPKNSK